MRIGMIVICTALLVTSSNAEDWKTYQSRSSATRSRIHRRWNTSHISTERPGQRSQGGAERREDGVWAG